MDDRLDRATLESIEQDSKRPRRYESSLRAAQAAQTHDAVLDAGRRLFLAQGYARTTMRAIAEEAGVAVDSVYTHFRSKSVLLTALMDQAHGGSAEVAVSERDWIREVRAEPDAADALATFVTNLAAVYDELAPLTLAVRAAAAADATAASLWSERRDERLAGLDGFASRLVDTGDVRDTFTREEVRDLLYAVASPDVFGLLVLDQGWTRERYVGWLTDTLRHQLLGR